MFSRTLVRITASITLCIAFSQHSMAQIYRTSAVSKVEAWQGGPSNDLIFQNNTSTALVVTAIDGIFGIHQPNMESEKLSLLSEIPRPEALNCGFFPQT